MNYSMQNWRALAHNGLNTGTSPKARRGKERLYGKVYGRKREKMAGCSWEQLVENELISIGVLEMPKKVIRARKFVEQNTVGEIANQPLAQLRKWKARFINAEVIAKLDKAIALRTKHIEDNSDVQAQTTKPKAKRKQTHGQAMGLVKANTNRLAKLEAEGAPQDKIDSCKRALASAQANADALKPKAQPKKAKATKKAKPKKAQVKETELGVVSVDVSKIEDAMKVGGFSADEMKTFMRAIQA